MVYEASFFRDILYKRVVDCKGERLGVVMDVAADPEGGTLSVQHLVVSARVGLGRSAPSFLVPWEAVAELTPRAIFLKVAYDEAVSVQPPPGRILLRRDLMDSQIVDVDGYKLLRVNDIRLHALDGTLKVAGLEIGLSGLLLRLALKKRLPRLIRRFGLKIRENVIPWDLVERFDVRRRRIQLKISKERLKSL